MGRAQIKRIENERRRTAVFSNRIKVVKKKTVELSTLCGVDACVVAFGQNGDESQIWPESPSEFARISERYQVDEDREKRQVGVSSFLQQKMKILHRELNQKRAENSCTWERQFDGLSEESLRKLVTLLDLKLDLVKKRIEMMKASSCERMENNGILEHLLCTPLPLSCIRPMDHHMGFENPCYFSAGFPRGPWEIDQNLCSSCSPLFCNSGTGMLENMLSSGRREENLMGEKMLNIPNSNWEHDFGYLLLGSEQMDSTVASPNFDFPTGSYEGTGNSCSSCSDSLLYNSGTGMMEDMVFLDGKQDNNFVFPTPNQGLDYGYLMSGWEQLDSMVASPNFDFLAVNNEEAGESCLSYSDPLSDNSGTGMMEDMFSLGGIQDDNFIFPTPNQELLHSMVNSFGF